MATRPDPVDATAQDLRRARQRARAQVAARLQLGEAAVDRVERAADLLLNAFGAQLRTMGGRLQLWAVFRDRPAALLQGLRGPETPRAAAKAVTPRLLVTAKPTRPRRWQPTRRRAKPAA